MSSETVHTEFVQTDYGKDSVKLLYVTRDGNMHHAKEVEVSTALTLNSQKEYVYGDNRDVVSTDSQKNAVYILAKQFGIHTIEQFSLKLCEHFLNTYAHVIAVNVKVEELPWKTMEINGEKHMHAFQMVRDSTRVCEVNQKINGDPVVCAGIRDLQVLKTTQSSFKDFIQDDYCTLPYTDDRVVSTIVTCNWWYNTLEGFCFNEAWEEMKISILEQFAGPADKGEYSPSVQNTLYKALKLALARIPQIDKAEMTLPNKHYFDVDFGRFPKLDFSGCTDEVYLPVDKPSGNIHAVLQRSSTFENGIPDSA